jgi:hypothetical protein
MLTSIFGFCAEAVKSTGRTIEIVLPAEFGAVDD